MTEKLTAKNYIGYALCDIGGMLAFTVMGSYLTVYYTDTLKIGTATVFFIMLIARIWDGVNDPLMGIIVQNRRAGKNGKYRPFILYGGLLLALSSVLVFIKIPGLSTAGYTAYAAVTYILYGMLYTVVLVPYGSLAAVMTTKENERSTLSMCRAVGGGIGSLPCTILFPMLVIVNNVLDARRLSFAMLAICAAMAVMYILSYRWTREALVSHETPERTRLGALIKSLLKNKAFVIMSIVGCLHIAVSMYLNTVNIYIFKDYYAKGGMLTLLTVAAYIPMLAMLPFVNKIIKKFGKKKPAVWGLAVSTLTALAVFIVRIKNPWIYVASSFFLNLGAGFMTLEIWAMATDIIDSQEWLTGRREEAPNYAVFTFMRKLGQALAAFAPLLVGLAGYDSALVGLGQDAATLEGMYTVATLVPFLLFAAMLVLMLFYPLDKQRADLMRAELAERRAAIEKS